MGHDKDFLLNIVIVWRSLLLCQNHALFLGFAKACLMFQKGLELFSFYTFLYLLFIRFFLLSMSLFFFSSSLFCMVMVECWAVRTREDASG